MRVDQKHVEMLANWELDHPDNLAMVVNQQLAKEVLEHRATLVRLKEWLSLVETSDLALDGTHVANCIRQMLESS